MFENTEKRQKTLLIVSLVAMFIVLGVVGQSVVKHMQINTVHSEIDSFLADYETVEEMGALFTDPEHQGERQKLKSLIDRWVDLRRDNPPIVNIPLLSPKRALGWHGDSCDTVMKYIASASDNVDGTVLGWGHPYSLTEYAMYMCLDLKVT